MSIIYQSGNIQENEITYINTSFSQPLLLYDENIIGFNDTILLAKSNTTYLVLDTETIQNVFSANISNNSTGSGFKFIDTSGNIYSLTFPNSNITLNPSVEGIISFTNDEGEKIYVNKGICESGYKYGTLSFDYEHTFPTYVRDYDFTFSMNVDITSLSNKKPNFFNLDVNLFGQLFENVLTQSMLINMSTFYIKLIVNPFTSNVCVNVNNIDTITHGNYMFTSNTIDIHTNIEYFEHKRQSVKLSNIHLFQGILYNPNNKHSCDNIFIGPSSGYQNKTAYSNIFLGSKSGYNNESGNHNIYVGDNASKQNTRGCTNITIGYDTCKETTSGNDNIYIGHNSGKAIINSTNNVCIGSNVCYWNNNGVNNVIIGKDSINFDKNYVDGFQISYKKNDSIPLYSHDITYKIKNTIYNTANTDMYISLPNYEYKLDANTFNTSSNIEFNIYFTYEQLYLTGNIQLYSCTQNIETLIYETDNIFKNSIYDPFTRKYLLHFKNDVIYN